mmetsp:Transcript_36032/g.91772  ORF Transcript_36032/g.91772 Transcript_36032/m.91772 type:complete len:238 (+) Transcript_36032:514-1227(+)
MRALLLAAWRRCLVEHCIPEPFSIDVIKGRYFFWDIIILVGFTAWLLFPLLLILAFLVMAFLVLAFLVLALVVALPRLLLLVPCHKVLALDLACEGLRHLCADDLHRQRSPVRDVVLPRKERPQRFLAHGSVIRAPGCSGHGSERARIHLADVQGRVLATANAWGPGDCVANTFGTSRAPSPWSCEARCGDDTRDVLTDGIAIQVQILQSIVPFQHSSQSRSARIADFVVCKRHLGK